MLKQRAVEERGHVLEETGQLQQLLDLYDIFNEDVVVGVRR